MKKSFLPSFSKGLIAFSFCAAVVGFVACGDESSSGPLNNETALAISSSIEDLESSSSVNEALSSSNVTELSSSDNALAPSSSEKSSSFKKVESSSSSKTDVSSSSTKIESSSSSVNVKESSSSSKVESSSSKNEVSSSSKNVQSSSSVKPVESSSSKTKSSSSEISSSSVKPAESSSSESSSSVKLVESSSSKESSSSLNPVESSSSEMSSSSSPALNSIYDAENNTLTDLRDGHVYKTVTIGTQIWMAENLNYLPKDTVGTFWAGRSVCGGGEYKSLQEGDCSIYGRLYETSFTENANYRKEICPDGWSIPSKKQYQNLITFLGDNVGNKLKDKDENLWSQSDNTNESGFSAIPSGYWSPYYGFNYLEKEGDAVAVLAMVPSSIQNALRIDENSYEFAGYGQWLFIAFRCIKN